MVAITSEEQNKVKRIFKKTEDSLRDLWDNFKCISIRILWIPEEEEKNKGYEKNFEEIIVENSQSSPRGTKSPIQDKSKEKHATAHTNQTKD